MKIGLVRHFEVIHPHKMFISSSEFKEWVNGYESAPIKVKSIEIIDDEWQACYSSNLSRAVLTAKKFYAGKIIETELLREIPLSPIFNAKVKLPFAFWTISGRVAGLLEHKSQIEKHTDIKKRVQGFISNILSERGTNILIVSHGGIMWYIKNELLANGFIGPNFKRAKNGYMYIFNKEESAD